MPLLLTLLLACSTDPEPLTCAQGELLDGDACVPEACGTGTWGDLQTDGDTIYVDASAEDGGDGSEESPFTLIQEGLDAQGKSGMVAVAAGTYVENLQMTRDHSGVHLAGRCRELVVIDASEGSEDEMLEGSGIFLNGYLSTQWTVSGVTVTGAPWGGITQAKGMLTVERIASTNNKFGIEEYSGAVSATDCILLGNRTAGGYLSASTATLNGVSILETGPANGGEGGYGLFVSEDSELTATDCTLTDNDYMGLWVQDSFLDASGCTLQGNHVMGLLLLRSVGTIDEVRILGTLPGDDGSYGAGVQVHESTLQATNCVLEDNAHMGLACVEGTLDATECTIQGNRMAGLVLTSASTATVQNVNVLETRFGPDGYFGRGFSVERGSTLDATDCLVQDNDEVGLNVQSSVLVAESCTIQGNR
ncbi:MAG: right-handed parallel beta-helix repeat-containing protein, partial [Myxococcota bacterium]|nr:right-handed parallel beta-helix repeat-containing protein [Myxococcota bacterium]